MFSNPEKNLIQFGINEGMYVADFGAGNGYYAAVMAEKVGGSGKVFCIDVQKDLLHKISKEAENLGLTNVEVVWGDIEKDNGSSLKTESVDVVVIANTLFMAEKKDKVVSEANRILRKKGRILLVEWKDSYAGTGPHQDHVVKEEDGKKLFLDAGFSFERNIEAGEHHYGIVFRKM